MFRRVAVARQALPAALTDLHLQRNLDGLDLCRFAKRSWEGTSTLVFAEDQDPDTILAAITSRVVDGIVQRTACVSSLVSAIASVLETAGAVAAIAVSLPLFRAAWELLRSLL